jgi:carboxyl-terminal processing protease
MKNQITLGRKTFIFLLVTCLVSVGFTLKFVAEVAAKENGATDRYRYLKTFTDVIALVEKNYVEPVDIETLVQGAVAGMLKTLDPHTGYLDKDIYKELQVETKGKFGGLGIEITVKDGLLTVVAPIEDSPAARAGVEAGDKIIKIDDEFTRELSLIDAVKKMRGIKGTPVTIHVQREGYDELIPITVVRDIIKVKSVRSRTLDDGFGYIRLAQFQEGSAREFKKAYAKLIEDSSEKKLKGLVLDLRNNPGGLLTQAIRVSDIFLKDGVIVYTEGRIESQKQKYFAHDDKSEPVHPIVVIVNGGSASASEIVAGALQDHRRALILGQQSFGKGSVQTILPMEDGDALKLTTALYFTKSGRSIQAQGIAPDIIVADKRYPKDTEELLEEDEPKRTKERDLPGALKNPAEKKSDEVDEEEAKIEKEERIRIGSRNAMKAELSKLLRDDPQLDEALRLLKTWDVFQGKPTIAADAEEAKTDEKQQVSEVSEPPTDG